LMNTIMVLVLLAIYAICITGLTLLLKLCRLPRRYRLASGFLLFGIIAGAMALIYSGYDSSVLFNLPAVLLGEGVYGLSIDLFGNPHSAHAHYTIPWLFRIPQVIPFVSVLFWGLLGLFGQIIFNRRRVIRRKYIASRDDADEHRGLPHQAAPAG